MNRILMTSSVTMAELQKSLDLVANNLANIDTNGYQSRHASFSSLLVQQLDNQPDLNKEAGRVTPSGIRWGSGASAGDTELDTTAGTLKETGRDLDLALSDNHLYFQIAAKDNQGDPTVNYTRDGAFYLSPETGNNGKIALVDKTGAFVMGTQGKIELPSNVQSVHIDSEGRIQATLSDGTTTQGGRLNIISVKRPQLLQAVGDNKFTLPNLSSMGLKNSDVLASPNGTDLVKQGYLISSNVNMTDEMNDLIMIERSYQLNARAESMADQMMGLINTIR